jgi:hypothetical protein
VTAKTPAAARRCPRCGSAAIHAFRPFCSQRCRALDLARWLDGSYGVPVVEEDGADDGELSRSDRDR